jgi:RNA polymerase sigma-70 factor (ECF subfamily)
LWAAEDLVQETLLRAFGTLGRVHTPVRNPRAYLLRTATNLWIDGERRRDRENAVVAEVARADDGIAHAPSGELRDAGRRLLERLAPRERAAVLLKDVFDLDLEETAEVLETSVGAVKAALHRGRERLREPEAAATARRRVPSVALVDRFVALFNAADKDALLALVLDNAQVDNLSVGVEWGRDAERSGRSWFDGSLDGHPQWPEWFQFEAQRFERAFLAGEPIVLHFHTRNGREAMDAVTRVEEEDGRIARLRSYGFCPETILEVGSTLGIEVLTGLYRAPTPGPGRYYEDVADDERARRA